MPGEWRARTVVVCLALLVASSVARGADSREALQKAAVLVQQGRLEEADREVQPALADPQTRAAACSVLGTIRFQQKRIDESTRLLEEAIKLEPRDPVLYFIQRLRDEAHRFVIGSHRKLRKKDIREAGLQEIPGIGPSRKRALLHHFGTLKEIERASIADLGKVPGVSAESARKIFEFFHAQPG